MRGMFIERRKLWPRLLTACLGAGVAVYSVDEGDAQSLDFDPNAVISSQARAEAKAAAARRGRTDEAAFREAADAELAALGTALEPEMDGPARPSADELRQAESEVEQTLRREGVSEEIVARRLTNVYAAARPRSKRQWRALSLPEALGEALRGNISIAQAENSRRQAGETAREKAAAFDTKLTASGAYNYANTYDRDVRASKYWRGADSCTRAQCFQEYDEWDTWYSSNIDSVRATAGFADAPDALGSNPTGDEEVAFDSYFIDKTEFGFEGSKTSGFLAHPGNANNKVYWLLGEGKSELPFNYMRFHKEKPEGYYTSTITASDHEDKQPWDDTNQLSFNLGLSQALPWGADFSLTQTTVYAHNYWYADGTYQGERYNDYYESYDKPWTSSLNASLNLPMPGSKYFGRQAVREVNLRKALISLRQADISVQRQANAVLGQVEAAFWDLTQAGLNLNAIASQRESQERVVQRTRRLFDIGKVDQYAMTQVEAQFETLRQRERTTLNSYELASNALGLLVNAERQALFLPKDYLVALKDRIDLTVEEALAAARGANPDVRSQQVQVEASLVDVQQKAAQLRPNVSGTASINLSQSNSLFGYESLEKAVGRTLRPDAVTVNTSVGVVYPLFNKEARSAYGQARVRRNVQQVSLRESVNQVERQVLNAFTDLRSAETRILIASNNLSLADLALRKALVYQESRGVTEFEMIAKNNDLLSARIQQIQAQIDLKKAEAALLTAMGAMTDRLDGGSGTSATRVAFR